MKVIWPAIIFAMIIVSSYATSVSVTITNLQAKSGLLQNVYFETVSGPASTTPATNTALTTSGSSGSYSIASGTSGYLWSPSFSSATSVPLSRLTFDVWASISSTNIGLDGSASAAASGTTITLSLSTTKSPDVLYLSTTEGGSVTVSTVASSPTLTWTQRVSLPFSNNKHAETWYAIWSSSGTISITVTLSGAASGAGVAYGISGANTAAPFDTNAAVPSTASGSAGTAASMTISTSNANDMIIGALGVKGNPTLTTGTGFTLVLTQAAGSGGNSLEGSDQYQVVSTTQSNLAVGYSWGGAQDWGIVADAITAASPATIALHTTDSSGTLVSTLLATTNTNPIPSVKTQIITVFSISAGSIPAGGYLEVILTAPAGASITVYWGVGQPTNFQVPRVVLT